SEGDRGGGGVPPRGRALFTDGVARSRADLPGQPLSRRAPAATAALRPAQPPPPGGAARRPAQPALGRPAPPDRGGPALRGGGGFGRRALPEGLRAPNRLPRLLRAQPARSTRACRGR